MEPVAQLGTAHAAEGVEQQGGSRTADDHGHDE
jgi:hypothetical protein